MKSKKSTVIHLHRNAKVSIPGLIAAAVLLFIAFPVLLTPLNFHAESFWVTILLAMIVYAAFHILQCSAGIQKNPYDWKGWRVVLIPAVLFLIFLLAGISGAKIFHAHAYASILQVQEADFTEDLPEAAGTDSIALMDTASAQMLGDREIGSLSNVVSQYDVSDYYSQIDYQGSPLKVSPLIYAGFFKWLNNKSEGVPGYVTVDPVSMSASYEECSEGMIYVPSAWFLQNAQRHIWLSYPTLMTGNLHFEIDEEGNPYYLVSVYKRTISLFGGKTVSGCVILDPVTGSMEHYDLEDVPTWVDVVYDGDTICTQYNWFGNYQNGYLNSLMGKKGCKQITTYTSEGEDSDDAEPSADYGYVAKDGDIWIYTGVTSVNSDSSNIGFLLANERTGESHYFTISGADEKSAMAAAEGEVQEKGYQASFPSLINVDGNPTYIMVLKDNSGLVKLYAAVNVQQYNLVTTASSQKECLSKYRTLLGIAEEGGDLDSVDQGSLEEELQADGEADITIYQIRDIDIDGNTWLYLISEDQQIYKAQVKNHEDMLLLQAGDQVHLTLSGNQIITCQK